MISMQFVIMYVITVGSCSLRCISTFHSDVTFTTGSDGQKCSENCKLHFGGWTFLQMSVHLLILEIRKRFLQFLLCMFSFPTRLFLKLSKAKQKYLHCESWLCYFKNGTFEVIETLLDLIIWLLRGGNCLFL